MATPDIANIGQASTAVLQAPAQNYTRPLAIVTTLFFMWGFLTCLNDILVPHLKSIFDLSYARVMLIQFAFFSAYFLFSIPWSKVVNAIGYQKTMVAGLLCMAVGAFLFLPAASSASFTLFLGASTERFWRGHRRRGRAIKAFRSALCRPGRFLRIPISFEITPFAARELVRVLLRVEPARQ